MASRWYSVRHYSSSPSQCTYLRGCSKYTNSNFTSIGSQDFEAIQRVRGEQGRRHLSCSWLVDTLAQTLGYSLSPACCGRHRDHIRMYAVFVPQRIGADVHSWCARQRNTCTPRLGACISGA